MIGYELPLSSSTVIVPHPHNAWSMVLRMRLGIYALHDCKWCDNKVWQWLLRENDLWNFFKFDSDKDWIDHNLSGKNLRTVSSLERIVILRETIHNGFNGINIYIWSGDSSSLTYWSFEGCFFIGLGIFLLTYESQWSLLWRFFWSYLRQCFLCKPWACTIVYFSF